MATCEAPARDAVLADLRAADETIRSAVGTKRNAQQDGHWDKWTQFCTSLGKNPYLEGEDISVQLHLLTSFGIRLRKGDFAAVPLTRGSRTVEDYLRTIASEIASMGSQNPRLDITGRVVPRIALLQRAWSKQDPSPTRVKPIPIQLLRHMVERANYNDPMQAAIADAAIIGFFYMLRPGEHTKERSNDHPFRLQDVSFACHDNPTVNAVC